MVSLTTYLVAAAIYLVIMRLAGVETSRGSIALSPGLLSPLGTMFALLVAFVAAQVWSDLDAADAAVAREAAALRGIVLLSNSFPGRPEIRLRAFVRRHVEEAVTREWPAMARQRAKLTRTSVALAQALQFAFALRPQDDGQTAAQAQIVTSIQDALEARRERIIISSSLVNWVQWSAIFLQAVCMLVAVAMVHADNRFASAVAMALIASGVAVSVVLIAAHNRPFSGEISVRPDALLQILPKAHGS